MALIIRASSFFTKRYLKLYNECFDFMETSALGGKRRFTYGDIDSILRSADQKTLSFQVGQQVFSIPVKPGKPQHDQVITQFVSLVSGAHQKVGGFPVYPR